MPRQGATDGSPEREHRRCEGRRSSRKREAFSSGDVPIGTEFEHREAAGILWRFNPRRTGEFPQRQISDIFCF